MKIQQKYPLTFAHCPRNNHERHSHEKYSATQNAYPRNTSQIGVCVEGNTPQSSSHTRAYCQFCSMLRSCRSASPRSSRSPPACREPKASITHDWQFHVVLTLSTYWFWISCLTRPTLAGRRLPHGTLCRHMPDLCGRVPYLTWGQALSR